MNRRLLLSLLPLTLAACSPSTPSSGPTSGAAPPAATSTEKTTSATPTATTDIATLGRHHWQLSNATDQSGERIAALFAHPDKPLQLDFAEGRISVDNACNRLGGSYRIDGDKLQVGPMVHTMMACADPAVKALDGAIDKRLHDQPTMTLLVDGDTPQLKLVTGDGDTLQFTGQPTAETRYGSQGKTAFLEVAARTVPCNHPEMPARQCPEGARAPLRCTGTRRRHAG